jgi:hypothetical protein
MDNWVSAILVQIYHAKTKREIYELDNGIQSVATNASKDDGSNPSRRLFLKYLESIDPEKGELIEQNVKAIHIYK